ncbi:MAG: ribosome biogenesis GTPase Der [Armatimonadota bacterium]
MTTGRSLPVVAIVGRPNVGKSALFNRLISRRLAIVEDTPGLTRDRLYADTEWRGRAFTVVDTGGLVSGPRDNITAQVRAQAAQALDEADLILFVVDVRLGLVPEDREIADVVRRARAPVLLVANKADDAAAETAAHEFHALGFGDPMPVSAQHGRGTGDLLDAVVDILPQRPPAEVEEDSVAVAIVGRPNVGKSSLINAILGEERVVVDPAPGTTRDAVDSLYERDGRRFVLIDTAGLRRRSRVGEPVEFFSAGRARRAIERADVAVLVLDATAPPSDQDQRIAREIADAGCGVVIALNKWDRVAKAARPDRQREQPVRGALRFISYAPIVVTSATAGWGITELFDAIARVAAAHRDRIGTGPLNRAVGDAVAAHQPPADKAGRRLRIFYATQPDTRPPVIVLFVNNPALLTDDYRRYLERALRSAFDLTGVPLRFVPRRRREQEVRT